MPSSLILERYELFEERTSELLRLAARADPFVLSAAMRDVGHEVRASCVVRCAAETEQLFRGALDDAAAAVTDSPMTVNQLPVGLRAYLLKTCRRSAPRVPSRTTHVMEMLAPTLPTANASIGLGEVSGDGRTIRAHHFLHAWALFQLPGQPFDVRGQIALNRVADYRNWIAHGTETAAGLSTVLARQATDLHQLISAVRSVAENFAIQLAAYVDDLP